MSLCSLFCLDLVLNSCLQKMFNVCATFLKGRGSGHVIFFSRILHPLNLFEMADDSIVKFCARVGPRSVCLVIANFPPDGRGQDHVTS